MSEFCFQTFVEFAGSAQIIANSKRCKVAHPRLAAPWHPHHSSTSPVLDNLLLSRIFTISYIYSNENLVQNYRMATLQMMASKMQNTCKMEKITSEYCNHRRDVLVLKERHRRALRLPSVCDRSRNLAIKMLRASFLTKEQPLLVLDDINASSTLAVGPRKRCRKRAMAFPDTMQKIVQDNKYTNSNFLSFNDQFLPIDVLVRTCSVSSNET